MTTSENRYVWAVLGIALVILGVFIYLYKTTYDELTRTQAEFASTRTELEQTIADLELRLNNEIQEKIVLEDILQQEKNRNEEFADQISEISGTVGILEKLSKTDEELLQKYSKVSFLNEHYIPSDLRQIDSAYAYDESRDYYLHGKVYPYLRRMIENAEDDGVTLYIRSAYRSFGTQSDLKNGYTVTYGSGANQFSADQGFSEHQLGTTIDFTTTGINGSLTGFGNTEAFDWLVENAHKYGFTLSYPEGNAYYIYEPWHWRFVGVELAERLKEDNIHFYDLDQRTIDEYLVNIFD